ncbi:cytochrome c [Motiliproteus sediminis]|uniref:cytochrome c n=1 Tax=Motiliproteus sediminis TaxID=1468178 RepID=UPI001AEFFAC3|nr:cytochrome c [Motiliproteus sediminis]
MIQLFTRRCWLISVSMLFGLLPLSVEAKTAVERGRYIFDLAGCQGCHTREEGELLAGGRELDTPFGRFYTPNITPDTQTGIGSWSRTQFEQAVRKGLSPEGEHYYPVFPYTSYTAINDRDIDDLWAYLQTVPAVSRANQEHELPWPFRWRFLMLFWKWLFFDEGPRPVESGKSEEYQRGAYIARALGHCGECHTPRDFLGAMQLELEFAGTSSGPEGGVIPNITPDQETGIGRWSEGDVDSLLVMGMLPDADFVGAGMGEVVDNSTAALTDSDRQALIRFLREIPPVRRRVGGEPD